VSWVGLWVCSTENQRPKINMPTPEILTLSSEVLTPYGKGTIKEIRSDGMVVVSPDSWLLAHGKAPIFYLNSKDVCALSKPLDNSEVLAVVKN
jgi:hypothetical protein